MKSHYNIKIRLMAGDEIAMGPGKADLLQAIDKTGSISAAAREMNMSYRRAWQLAHTMNTCFKKPLVEKTKGGTQGGGASLTEYGKDVLRQYQAIQAQADKSVSKSINSLSKSLRTKL